MTEFKEREKAFEAKYKQDQELQFKATARRNKLLGLWAAEQLGVTGEAAEAYAREVVAADFAKPGDSDVVEKVLGDFAAKGVEMTEHRLRTEMDRLMDEAKRQIMESQS
jgi:hypothetical protein